MGVNVDAAIATPVELDVWKDPQGFILCEHVRDEAWCYFQCWTDEGRPDEERVACLHFSGVWHLASTRFSAIRVVLADVVRTIEIPANRMNKLER